MKKFALVLLSVLMCFSFSACGIFGGGNGDNPEGDSAAKPTSAQVVNAIKTGEEDKEQNYDFSITLELVGSVGFISKGAKAKYDCKYRYDTETKNLQFMRKTSGELLIDSTKYIYGTDSARATLKMNDDGTVKKQSVEQTNDTLDLLNLPFVAFMNALQASNVKKIEKSGSGYSANIGFASNDSRINTILNVVGLLDTDVSFNGVTFPNPADGIGMKFNLTSDGTRLDEYELTASLAVEVKKLNIGVNLTYSQKRNDTPIDIPKVSGIVIDRDEIAQEVTAIKTALLDVKDDPTYALDLTAVNEMDPGWKVTATKDTFQSRLYKNTDGARVDFNNSYEFHNHHETDGKETYKYTLGNIQDGTVHLVSRKGNNDVKPSTGSADERFDYLTKLFMWDADKVDCLKKTTKSGKTVYTLYLKDSVIVQTSKAIVEILNSNPAEGVLTVQNYFNDSNYTVKDAELTVVMNGGSVEEIDLETKLRYNPTYGEYTENNITLDNSLKLLVNESSLLEEAQKYEAPEKDRANLDLSGLIAAKYYII